MSAFWIAIQKKAELVVRWKLDCNFVVVVLVIGMRWAVKRYFHHISSVYYIEFCNIRLRELVWRYCYMNVCISKNHSFIRNK